MALCNCLPYHLGQQDTSIQATAYVVIAPLYYTGARGLVRGAIIRSLRFSSTVGDAARLDTAVGLESDRRTSEMCIT